MAIISAVVNLCNYNYQVDLVKEFTYAYTVLERQQLFNDKEYDNGHIMATLQS